MSDNPKNKLTDNDQKIELLEEKAILNKKRIKAAELHVKKVVKQRTVNVPVTLNEEVLIIDTKYRDNFSEKVLKEKIDNSILYEDSPADTDIAQVIINGQNVPLDSLPYEITISKEVAKVVKETYVVEEVVIDSHKKTKKGHIVVDLQHEELEIEKTKD